MKRLLCMMGFHLRSRGQAHDAARGFVSVCRYCGQPMIKDRRGRWQTEASEDGAAEAEPPAR